MIPRLLMKPLLRLAGQYPVITLTGPRQSGKSTLCKHCFPSYHYLSLEDVDNRQYAKEDPRGFLARFSDQGIILDEIQHAPDLVSYIQTQVDLAPDRLGQFILTGSQQFEVSSTVNQSLAGRTAILKLLPLAYEELMTVRADDLPLNELLYTGFFPRIYDKKLNPTEAASFYLSTYVERDVRQIKNIKDLSAFERFLKLCATQIGQLTNYARLGNDCGVDTKTIQSWLSILKASFILFELPPFYKNFRKRLTKSNKIYFTDVGLLCYLLGITQPQHLEAHPLKGLIFENFIVIEFLKNCYNNVQSSNLYFFRDHIGNEVDLILDRGLFQDSVEIKWAQTFSSSQIKGLNYYQQLATAENRKQILIYAGQSRTLHDVQVWSYTQLAPLFDMLKKQ